MTSTSTTNVTTGAAATPTPTGLKRSNLQLPELLGQLVLPGDEFSLLSEDKVVLGPGLHQKVTTIDPSSSNDGPIIKTAVVSRAGTLHKQKPNTYYVELTARNYIPYKKEDIVGVITKKTGDNYVVDIGTRDRVTLSKFAFEGATKKNRPDLKIGDIVFGRLLDLPSDYPFEITCVTPSGKAMGLGALEQGLLFQIPFLAVKSLHLPKKFGGSGLLKDLGDVTGFEIVVGNNGYVWVRTDNELLDLLLSQTIQASAKLPTDEHSKLVKSYKEAVNQLQSSW